MTFIDNSAKTNWKFIGIVAVIAILIGGGILALSLQKETPFQIVETVKPSVVTEYGDVDGSTELTASWQTYRNEEFGFEVKFPADWAQPRELKDRVIVSSSNMDPDFEIVIRPLSSASEVIARIEKDKE